MNEEPKLERSSLSQELSEDGHRVDVEIYRLEGEDKWVLEVVDEFGNSTVWDDLFLEDSEALLEVKNTILQEGISSLIGPEDGKRPPAGILVKKGHV